MAAVVMSSCSSDEVVNNYSQDNAIEFGTYVGRDAVSRVAVTELADVKENGFGVFATYNQGGTTGTKPNFMNNQEVKWTVPTQTTAEGDGEGEAATEETGSWTYSPIKYWPNNADAEVSFWAYSPYSDENDNTGLEVPTFAVTDGTDFVVTEETVSGKLGYNEKVKLTFAHVMSRIGFKVETVINETDNHQSADNGKDDEETDASENDFEKGDDDQALTTVVVTEVSLNYAFVNKGTMTWSAATESETEGKWNLSLTSTSTLGSESYHKLTVGQNVDNNEIFANVTETEYEKAVGTEEAEDYQAAKKLVGQVAGITSEKLNHDDAYFMVLPQEAENMTITVKYSVITKDDKLATGYSKVDNEVTSEPFTFNFERNHAYNFVLHLGLNSVEFEAEVSETWEESDVIVNVPLNEATTKTQQEPEA